jgi:hypothetical protein
VVVQLVRIRACHARGRGFESRPFRLIKDQFDSIKASQLWGFFMYYLYCLFNHFIYFGDVDIGVVINYERSESIVTDYGRGV